MKAPRKRKTSVFVSYSHDSEEHKAWVARLAQALHDEDDLTVNFDGFELYGGKDAPHFMEKALACRRIVVVCTPNYVKKADRRRGGVGYETSIITSELARSQSSDKFIPLTREGHSTPKFLGSKIRIDANEPRPFEKVLEDLLSAIRKQPPVPRVTKSPGNSPQPSNTPTQGLVSASASPPVVDLSYRGPNFNGTHRITHDVIFSLEYSGHGDLQIAISNETSERIRHIEVEVRFTMVPSVVIRFGELAPYDTRYAKVNEASDDMAPLVTYIGNLFEHLPTSVDPNGHFILRYREASGSPRATVFYLQPTAGGDSNPVGVSLVPARML